MRAIIVILTATTFLLSSAQAQPLKPAEKVALAASQLHQEIAAPVSDEAARREAIALGFGQQQVTFCAGMAANRALNAQLHGETPEVQERILDVTLLVCLDASSLH